MVLFKTISLCNAVYVRQIVHLVLGILYAKLVIQHHGYQIMYAHKVVLKANIKIIRHDNAPIARIIAAFVYLALLVYNVKLAHG